MRIALVATTALISTLAAMPAVAQEVAETSGGIEDIVVTAQRRAERVQDVPIAISAFSADQMQARGVTNALDIAAFVPNLIAQNNTGLGSANSYYLRGLGSSDSIATFDTPVGTYVDDIYLSRQNANNLSMFDVERVEVLRGPQGTLFGRNTTGGAISMIMRKPGDEFGGYAEVGYGRYNKKIVRGSVDLPVADTLGVKVSAYYQDDDGFAKNVTTGERLNDSDGWGVRLGVRGDILPTVRWNGSFMHVVSLQDNILNFDCNPANPTECGGRYVTTGFREGGGMSQFAPLVISGRKAQYGQGAWTTSDLIVSNLAVDIADGHTLTFITGFLDTSSQYAYDYYDGRSGPTITTPMPPVRGYARGGFVIANDSTHQQFTQEVKLNGSLGGGFVDYVAGLYYFDEQNESDFADIFTLSPTTSLLLADRVLSNGTEAWAGYAQADFNLTNTIKLTAGIRYTDETKTLGIFDNRPQCNDGTIEATCLDNQNLISPTGLAIPRSQTTKMWTPRFAANFKPTDDVLLFASATKGFKSGGWNARATSATQFLPFGPEKVWSYEAGIKSDWFDNRVRANITGFWMEVEDLQVLAGLLTPAGTLSFLTRNFADYQNKGIEAEFVFVPVDGLNLYANIGYQKDKYKVPGGQPDYDQYGIQSVNAQQAECQAALALGQIPGGASGSTYPRVTACASGIVGADGTINTPVRTPDWTISAGASYDIPLGSLSLVPSVNASYRGKQETSISNLSIWSDPVSGSNGSFAGNLFGDGEFITGSYSKAAVFVNASITLNGPESRWSLSAECTNCFDEASINSALSNYSYINAPMSWTVRARYNF